LIINAQQSICSDGIIAITLKHYRDGITLKVSDTGRGIPQGLLPRIFDPFFSTKGILGSDTGAGIGMGLSICRNIAHEHGGELNVESIVDVGTIFELILPQCREKRDELIQYADPPVIEPIRLLIFSPNNRLFSHYFHPAQKNGVDIYWISPPAAPDQEETWFTLVICDGGATSASDKVSLEEYCSRNDIPLIVLNQTNIDEEAIGTSEVTCQDLPGLDEIIRNNDMLANKSVSTIP
jgi:hypothetical protein